MITEDYVSFETAKLLKKKGFDESFCVANAIYTLSNGKLVNLLQFVGNTSFLGYNLEKCIIAPSLALVMKWLREEYKYFIEIRYSFEAEDEYGYKYKIRKTGEDDVGIWSLNDELYGSYEQTCETAIRYTLENLI